jgi:hypothetical protein
MRLLQLSNKSACCQQQPDKPFNTYFEFIQVYFPMSYNVKSCQSMSYHANPFGINLLAAVYLYRNCIQKFPLKIFNSVSLSRDGTDE